MVCTCCQALPTHPFDEAESTEKMLKMEDMWIGDDDERERKEESELSSQQS